MNFLIGLILRASGILELITFNHEKYEYKHELVKRYSHIPGNDEYIHFFEYILLLLLNRNSMLILTAITDYYIGSQIMDSFYFILTSVFCDVYSTFENIFILLSFKEISIPMDLLFMANPYFIALSNDTFIQKALFMINHFEVLNLQSKVLHYPAINVFWFFYLNIFEQYHVFFHYLFFLTMLYLSSLTTNDIQTKITILLFFSNSTYKNYILFYCLSKLNRKRFNLPLMYLFLIFLNLYVNWLYLNLGIGNPNFINWTNLIFVIITLLDHNSEVFFN